MLEDVEDEKHYGAEEDGTFASFSGPENYFHHILDVGSGKNITQAVFL